MFLIDKAKMQMTYGNSLNMDNSMNEDLFKNKISRIESILKLQEAQIEANNKTLKKINPKFTLN
tara:strand:+ start:328 stop:519 length:192 start_codon:yes stop_codon:yes gene_type:complete